MILSAYFDESERFEPSEPFAVAGYVFKPAGYKHFVRKWARMLASGPTETPFFHMTELYAGRGLYQGWSVEQRAAILARAVDAVRKHTYCGISILLSQSEFEKLAPPQWRFEYGSIYAGACQLALRTTAYWMDQHRCSDPIAYVFENGHAFWDEADSILSETGKHPQLGSLYHYNSHRAINKRDAYGLQAADMLAWTMARFTVGVPVNHTMAAFAPLFQRLASGQSGKYQLFHPTGDLLRRFFQEQLSRNDHVVVDLKKAKRMRLR